MPALSNFSDYRLLCPSGASASGLCAASAPRITPFLTSFASVFTPFVSTCAPLLTPFHTARLGLGIWHR
jgi:hypothetical protein